MVNNLLVFLVLALFSGYLKASEHPLRLNQLQVIGSHNSYKSGLDKEIAKKLDELEPHFTDGLRYAHPSLTAQLDLGLRQLEIDIVADSLGGKYLQPMGQKWASSELHTPAQKQQLAKPGFKVLHVPDIDVATHCATFEHCLQQLKSWSERNVDHLPVYILFNAKETGWDKIDGEVPEQFSVSHYQALNQLVEDTLGKDKLITPESLTVNARTLSESITNNGWPQVNKVRGKFAFIFDANPRQLKTYEQVKAPVIFAAFPVSHPDAAFLLYNDPVKQAEEIKAAIEKGFIVRTRADEFSVSASPKDRAVKALRSGAQIISTDYYQGAPQIPVEAPLVSLQLLDRSSKPRSLFTRCIHLPADVSCEL